MAKKQKAQAMVKYNPETDAFELWLRSNERDEWGFSCSSTCRAVEGGSETTHIHFSLLR